MSSVIAIVKSLVGQVFALSPDGVQRLLVEGDRLFSGDQVMTGADGRVTLELVDGRILDLGRDSQWSQADLEPAAAPSIAQDAPSVAELQRAISAGDDPTQTLDATAAGPGGTAAGAGNGAAGGGSSYVILEATADQVQPSIGYPTLGLASSAESVEDTPATPLFQATAQPVTPADVAPTTRDQTLATDEDTPLRGAVSAEDGNGDALSYSLGDAPAHGTLVLNADGSFVYTPAANFNGGDRFTVTVDDGQGNRVVSTVVVEVAPVNDAPVANPDSASTPSATPVTIDVLRNDSDVDGDPLTLTGASAANGSVTVNPDGSLSYTPNDGFSGTDTITYGVADGQGGTAGSSVTVTVTAPVPPPQPANTPPEARPDSATTQQNRPVTVNVLANDRDADGDALSVTGASASHGSVTVNANGTLSYTPGSGFTGTDTITYGIADGHGGTASSTVTITVTAPAGPANAAPIATADNASTAIDTPVTVNVLANDRDPDGDALTVTGARADHGSVTVNANGTLSYTPG
uniref:retention module-containing protein n=1 Tax=Pseudomonas sp. RIT-PI-AD TaxID=3035294 RepID=UPI0021DA78A7